MRYNRKEERRRAAAIVGFGETCEALTIIFAILQWGCVIHWPLVWVLSPLWIGIAVSAFIHALSWIANTIKARRHKRVG